MTDRGIDRDVVVHGVGGEVVDELGRRLAVAERGAELGDEGGGVGCHGGDVISEAIRTAPRQ